MSNCWSPGLGSLTFLGLASFTGSPRRLRCLGGVTVVPWWLGVVPLGVGCGGGPARKGEEGHLPKVTGGRSGGAERLEAGGRSIYLPARVGLCGGLGVKVGVGGLGGLLVARVGSCTSHVLTLGIGRHIDDKSEMQTIKSSSTLLLFQLEPPN